MRKYRPTAASPVRVDFGVELDAGLRHFPETTVYAADFEKLNNDLFAQYLVRLGARKPMVAARVPVRFANFEADRVIRACAHAAEEADGGKGGPIFKSILKDGLNAAVKPDGVQQIPATQTVIKDMNESAAYGIDAFRTAWLPRLQDALAVLQKAADVLEARRKDYLAAFSDENALRNQHRTAIERLQGQVRTAFPGNTALQDLVFPEPDDESDEPAAAKAAPPAPAPAPSAPTPSAPAAPI